MDRILVLVGDLLGLILKALEGVVLLASNPDTLPIVIIVGLFLLLIWAGWSLEGTVMVIVAVLIIIAIGGLLLYMAFSFAVDQIHEYRAAHPVNLTPVATATVPASGGSAATETAAPTIGRPTPTPMPTATPEPAIPRVTDPVGWLTTAELKDCWLKATQPGSSKGGAELFPSSQRWLVKSSGHFGSYEYWVACEGPDMERFSDLQVSKETGEKLHKAAGVKDGYNSFTATGDWPQACLDLAQSRVPTPTPEPTATPTPAPPTPTPTPTPTPRTPSARDITHCRDEIGGFMICWIPEGAGKSASAALKIDFGKALRTNVGWACCTAKEITPDGLYFAYELHVSNVKDARAWFESTQIGQCYSFP